MRVAFEADGLSSQMPLRRHDEAVTCITTDVEDAVTIVQLAANIDACADGMELVDLIWQVRLVYFLVNSKLRRKVQIRIAILNFFRASPTSIKFPAVGNLKLSMRGQRLKEDQDCNIVLKPLGVRTAQFTSSSTAWTVTSTATPRGVMSVCLPRPRTVEGVVESATSRVLGATGLAVARDRRVKKKTQAMKMTVGAFMLSKLGKLEGVNNEIWLSIPTGCANLKMNVIDDEYRKD
jgi:hypothetical protein